MHGAARPCNLAWIKQTESAESLDRSEDVFPSQRGKYGDLWHIKESVHWQLIPQKLPCGICAADLRPTDVSILRDCDDYNLHTADGYSTGKVDPPFSSGQTLI